MGEYNPAHAAVYALVDIQLMRLKMEEPDAFERMMRRVHLSIRAMIAEDEQALSQWEGEGGFCPAT